MKNGKENNQQEQKTQTTVETVEPILFTGKDIITDFKRSLTYIPKDSKDAFRILQIRIDLGKELLPTDLEDTEEQKIIDKIYKKASDTLKEQWPKKRSINFSYVDIGGKRYTVLKLEAGDASNCSTEKEEFMQVKEDFIQQQYEQHCGNLQEVYNEIFHMLTIHDIIKKEDKTPDELIEELIKNKYKTKFEPKGSEN